ncbi:hypothetical protein DY120_07320 [Apilactobacillus micheneri]|uniref:Uncharacterized protein n=1 Tax=Apilactobacillus micheneri TaxID=1899430 RepID=A0ABY2YX09_9LACO|nr:hypothetical protein [Apilactobacillus micheneri]TPR23108.1 hypothetical protein DY114_07305 [Apilactobacillus micheneri]TPR24426.1 hypothetical protein DY111_07320 [Apilactobacillus micheneri]TPR29373.1 hypothetical protein DY120_07320 [Apilactobacillus micheneri]TPR34580.1 hypothetical protein DY027_07310 [Apilactobacillus micheneri]
MFKRIRQIFSKIFTAKDYKYYKTPIYKLEYAQLIDENNKMLTYTDQVTIPPETLKKLQSDKKYQFYLFNDEDGLNKFVASDVIISLYRVV